ncbi:hypothetical protein N8979_01475 [bacterium]|nr:hypothetical protein [bacterium]
MSGFKGQTGKKNAPQNPVTLTDLAAESLGVFCWCNRCGHNAEMPTAPLIAHLGPLFPVPELGRHLRCSSCNARDIATRPAWPHHGGGAIAKHE